MKKILNSLSSRVTSTLFMTDADDLHGLLVESSTGEVDLGDYTPEEINALGALAYITPEGTLESLLWNNDTDYTALKDRVAMANVVGSYSGNVDSLPELVVQIPNPDSEAIDAAFGRIASYVQKVPESFFPRAIRILSGNDAHTKAIEHLTLLLELQTKFLAKDPTTPILGWRAAAIAPDIKITESVIGDILTLEDAEYTDDELADMVKLGTIKAAANAEVEKRLNEARKRISDISELERLVAKLGMRNSFEFKLTVADKTNAVWFENSDKVGIFSRMIPMLPDSIRNESVDITTFIMEVLPTADTVYHVTEIANRYYGYMRPAAVGSVNILNGNTVKPYAYVDVMRSEQWKLGTHELVPVHTVVELDNDYGFLLEGAKDRSDSNVAALVSGCTMVPELAPYVEIIEDFLRGNSVQPSVPDHHGVVFPPDAGILIAINGSNSIDNIFRVRSGDTVTDYTISG